MRDEYIKEITIAMINNGRLNIGQNNQETAKEIAAFINTLRDELNNYTCKEPE